MTASIVNLVPNKQSIPASHDPWSPETNYATVLHYHGKSWSPMGPHETDFTIKFFSHVPHLILTVKRAADSPVWPPWVFAAEPLDEAPWLQSFSSQPPSSRPTATTGLLRPVPAFFSLRTLPGTSNTTKSTGNKHCAPSVKWTNWSEPSEPPQCRTIPVSSLDSLSCTQFKVYIPGLGSVQENPANSWHKSSQYPPSQINSKLERDSYWFHLSSFLLRSLPLARIKATMPVRWSGSMHWVWTCSAGPVRCIQGHHCRHCMFYKVEHRPILQKDDRPCFIRLSTDQSCRKMTHDTPCFKRLSTDQSCRKMKDHVLWGWAQTNPAER